MLKERYLQFMYENSPSVYNPLYKTSKVKSKLMKKLGSCIKLWQSNYKSELVYSSEIPQIQAIETVFEVAALESKHVEEAALVRSRIITESHKESVKLPWPPSSNNLLSGIVHPPPLLENFLSILQSGKQKNEASEKKKQLAGSFAQDIYTAVTNGQWAMPKHLLLGMSVRHLTGSAELITVLNRFGHCASYSVLLELETAMSSSIKQWQMTNKLYKLRYNQFMKKFSPKQGMLLSCYDGVDLSLLPPCRSSLKMHIRRAKECLIWCKADQATPDIPPPDGHGWYQENGKLSYQWTDGDLMPKEVVHVLIEELPDDEDEENEENPEIVSYNDEIYDSEN